MILADTSVWVDYFRGKETSEMLVLTDLISSNQDLCVTGIVLTEILQGISSESQYHSVKAMLDALVFLPMTPTAYYLAADIYRGARSKGQVIRNTIDCLIAACAIVHHVPLLQSDRDFITITRFSALRLALVKP